MKHRGYYRTVNPDILSLHKVVILWTIWQWKHSKSCLLSRVYRSTVNIDMLSLDDYNIPLEKLTHLWFEKEQCTYVRLSGFLKYLYLIVTTTSRLLKSSLNKRSTYTRFKCVHTCHMDGSPVGRLSCSASVILSVRWHRRNTPSQRRSRTTDKARGK